MARRLVVFGFGYSAQALARRLTPKGWRVAATWRTDPGPLTAAGVQPLALDDADGLTAALADAQVVLITAAPTAEGCPALPVLVQIGRAHV